MPSFICIEEQQLTNTSTSQHVFSTVKNFMQEKCTLSENCKGSIKSLSSMCKGVIVQNFDALVITTTFQNMKPSQKERLYELEFNKKQRENGEDEQGLLTRVEGLLASTNFDLRDHYLGFLEARFFSIEHTNFSVIRLLNYLNSARISDSYRRSYSWICDIIAQHRNRYFELLDLESSSSESSDCMSLGYGDDPALLMWPSTGIEYDEESKCEEYSCCSDELTIIMGGCVVY